MNHIQYLLVLKARKDLEKEIVSENMLGLDFTTLLYQSIPVVQLMRITEEYGDCEMEFKKGEW